MSERHMPSWMTGPNVPKLIYICYRIREYFRTRGSEVRRARDSRSAFYARLWHEAADELGASIEDLGDDFMEIRLGGASTRVQQNCTSIDNAATVAVARNKALVHRLLARAGLKTPDFCEFTLESIGAAISFLEKSGAECVIKPASGGGGDGVTTGVRGVFDLIRAAANAALYGHKLLIEEQEMGDVYRLLYLDGKLLDAVLRKAPTVIADGRSSIRELVRAENEKRLSKGASVAHSVVHVDMDMRRTLAKQGFDLSSVPKKDTVVILKTVINGNSKNDNVSAAGLLCKAIVDDGAAAAAAIGVRLAGVDLITTEPSLPLAVSGGSILEVNTMPSYHHHYYKRDGCYPVALHLIPYLLPAQESRRNTLAA